MSTTKHTLETTWPHGCDDVQVEIGFRFTPGYPGDRTDPPCPDEAEITSVHMLIDGERRGAPAAMVEAMDASDRLYQEMIEVAHDECQPDPDDARDRALDEALP